MTTVNMTIDTQRMVSMIDMASRDTTVDGEAVNALRLVKRDLKKAGVELVDVIHLNTKKTNGLGVTRETIAMLRDENAKLQQEVAKLRLELDAKTYENAHLTQHIRESVSDTPAPKSTHPTPKEFYSWIEFHNAGTARYGKSKGFQLAFMEAYPEFNSGDIAVWRRLSKVPARAMELVATMPIIVDTSRGKDWTNEERDYLCKILAENPRIKMQTLASKLSREFGRTITEGAAKAAKYRS